MIETYLEEKKYKNGDTYSYPTIKINGEPFKELLARTYSKDFYKIEFNKKSIFDSLSNCKLNEFLQAKIGQIEIGFEAEFFNLYEEFPKTLYKTVSKVSKFNLVNIPHERYDREHNQGIYFFVKAVLGRWTHTFSYQDYKAQIFKQLEANNPENIIFNTDRTIYFFIPEIKYELTLKEAYEYYSGIIKSIHQLAIENLQNSTRNSVTIQFSDFPSNVRVYCEQYLQYFIEFLRDLGVDAISDLKHDVGKVLFTVTPQDKKISLEKIHEALNIYLELPKSPLVNVENPENGIREIKYIQEVNTLKMRLSQAEMQTRYEKQLNEEKERVIQTLELFAKSVLEEKLKLPNSDKPSNDKKKLLKGTIEVGKLKIRDGMEVDIPKLLENTKLDTVFDQLEEYLSSPHITELKLNEPEKE